MLSRKMIALFVTMISVLSLASMSHAAVISIDFNISNVKGVGPSTTPTATGNPTGTFGGMGALEPWNALNMGPETEAPVNSPQSSPPVTADVPLLQSGGASTSVVFSITSGSPYEVAFFQPTLALRGDELFLTNGESLSWSFTGLIPGNVYDLRFYGNLNGADVSSPGYTVVGGTVMTTGTQTDRQALAQCFEAVAASYGSWICQAGPRGLSF